MPTIADVTTQALSFPSKSRAILADLLLDSLNEVESTNYDKLWLIEAKRRDKEMLGQWITTLNTLFTQTTVFSF